VRIDRCESEDRGADDHEWQLPSILEGVPLKIRTVSVNIKREGFMFNPPAANRSR
jgi:hypothetical protein